MMPLYDPGITLDKQPTVIDIGSKYTKFGFAGEPSPRCIIPSEVKIIDTSEIRKIYSYTSEEDLYCLLVEFLHVLYFKYALFSPKNRRIVVVESLLSTTIFKDTLAKVLFNHYKFAAVTFVSSHLVCVNTLAIPSALVIDVGYEETVIIPVFENIAVLKAWQAQPWGAAIIEKRIRSLLIEEVEKSPDSEEIKAALIEDIKNLSESTVEDIRVRCCFVTTFERSLELAEGRQPVPVAPEISYRLNGEKVLVIPGTVREKAYEVIFEKDADVISLPNIILDSILQCSLDIRKKLAENLCIVGGTSMALGFRARLDSELRHLINSPTYKDKLFLKTFKYHTPPIKANCVSWLGGSIFGATESSVLHSITKENYYTQHTSFPDWSHQCIVQPDGKLNNILNLEQEVKSNVINTLF